MDNAIHWINTLANGGKEFVGPWRPNGHHDYGLGVGAGAVENAVDLSTFFFSTFDMNKFVGKNPSTSLERAPLKLENVPILKVVC